MKYIAVILFSTLFLSACSMTYSNLNRQALEKEQLELKNTAAEMRRWQTDDLTIHYNMQDSGDFITLSGYVEVSDSVTFTFPRAEFLKIYIYLLNSDGISISRHTIHPEMSSISSFRQRSPFSKKIAKVGDTASFAFGYWGNFIDTDNDDWRGMFQSGDEWQIFHSPFEEK